MSEQQDALHLNTILAFVQLLCFSVVLQALPLSSAR